eukprot:1158830-Pelagomonas_calceolata.AAC.6
MAALTECKPPEASIWRVLNLEHISKSRKQLSNQEAALRLECTKSPRVRNLKAPVDTQSCR